MVTVLNVTARDESVVIHARKHHRTEHQPAPVSAELYCTLRDSSAKAFEKTNPWLKAGLKVAGEATGKDSFHLPEELLISIS